MTELDLYKYIQENSIEWHRLDHGDNFDILMFSPINEIERFYKLLSPGLFDHEGVECHMKDGYFAFWMKDICDYYGIEINNVFKGYESNYITKKPTT